MNKRANIERKGRVRRHIMTVAGHLVLILGALTMVTPFVWMALTSLKPFTETIKLPISWLPKEPTLQNFATVFQKMDFGRAYFNTILVTVCITAGQVFVCSLAAYSFARLNFPGRDAIFFLMLSILMLPFQMIMIPRYLMIVSFGWVETYAALIIPGIASAWGTFFMRQFFFTIPREIDEAAKLDGCGYFKTYWQILLPLCSNGIMALVIFTVLWAWNDMLWPILVTSSNKMRVLSVVLATLKGQYTTENNLMMAAGVITTIPMLIVFIIFQKKLIEGIALTGVKA